MFSVSFIFLTLITIPYIKSQDCRTSSPLDCSNPAKSRYRTFDGSCNNLGIDGDEEKPKWGKAVNCYYRVMDPEFGDTFGRVLRKSKKNGKELPNARHLSNFLMTEEEAHRDPHVSQMLMNWGQVLGNEITYPAGIDNMFAYDPEPCCSRPKGETKFDDCSEVNISSSDPFYGKYNFSCLNFIRSPACIRCKVQPRTPLNLHTTHIDAGTIYGNCLLDSNRLREFKGGLLKDSQTNLLREVGTQDVESAGFCAVLQKKYYPEEEITCFKSGDSYVNNNPFKTALVTALYRQHNRVARNLAKVNPQWDDERLYQESRKIVGAIMEVITYQEFLPSLLSPETMKTYNLEVSSDQFTEYKENLNPSTSAEFTAVGMRSIGHSMINGNTSMVFFDGRRLSYPLKDYFFYQKALHEGYFDALIKGSVVEPANMVDIYMDDVARNLFQKVHPPYGPPYGNDISTIDIMRGRDFGVASYLTFRKFCDDSCKMTDIESFEALATDGVISYENAIKLSKAYQSPGDIDLYTGMLIETPLPGSLMGPTGNCIWGKEFHRKKFGDRYYFEHGNQAGSFTQSQLSSLKKVTLAKILCQNGDEYPNHKIQGKAMLLPSQDNPEVDCSSLPDLDWLAWAPVPQISNPESWWNNFVNGFNRAFNISKPAFSQKQFRHGSSQSHSQSQPANG